MERRHAADEKAGVNYVSINIFSWARLQPDEETYDFSTLDKIMDMLAENGIGADLVLQLRHRRHGCRGNIPIRFRLTRTGRAFCRGRASIIARTAKTMRGLRRNWSAKLRNGTKAIPRLSCGM